MLNIVRDKLTWLEAAAKIRAMHGEVYKLLEKQEEETVEKVLINNKNFFQKETYLTERK